MMKQYFLRKRTLSLLFFSFVSVLIYVTAFAAKRHLFPSSWVLTEGLELFLIFLPILVIALFLLCKKSILSPDTGVAVFLIFFLSALCFNLTVPAIFDRSVTVYLLNSLDNRGAEGMTEREIEREFISIYFDRNYALRKRLDEQTRSGNLSYKNRRYYITENGHRIMVFSRFLSKLYNLDSRIVEQRKENRQSAVPDSR